MDTSTNKEKEDSFETFDWIKKYAPCFVVEAKDIKILQNPSEFYGYLKDMTSNSKSRIILSSLYIGTGSMEHELINAIDSNMNKNENVRLKILLDYCRGTRGSVSSKKVLENFKAKYHNRCDLFLYHNPRLRGLTKKLLSERANEILGVMHMKIYIIDNDLIISGANLSNDYFINRQDRYIILKNCEKLCNYYESIIDSISEFSFSVNKNGQVEYLNKNTRQHPFLGNFREFSHGLSTNINKVFKNYESINERKLNDGNSKAFVYPLIQLHDCDIRRDEQVTTKLFENAPSMSKIELAVGYFNLTKNYINSILKKSLASYNVLLSSPEANGFFESNGFSKYIPKIYSNIEENFFKSIPRHHKPNRDIYLNEYNRPNWTFHGKGLWYYPKNKSSPNMTIVGSSNFGYRSVYRDIEAQLVIYSDNQQLQDQLHNEQVYLFDKSEKVTERVFLSNYRKTSLWLRSFVRVFKSYF